MPNGDKKIGQGTKTTGDFETTVPTVVPTAVRESIADTRVDMEEAGELPADITTEEIMGPSEGMLKLLNTTAKFFPDQAIEQLSREDIFPGFQNVREAGSVTGRIIGRQPIFVGGGGLFPTEIVEARKRSLENAARAKAAAGDAILSGVPKTKPPYQEQVRGIFWGIANDIGEHLDWDFRGLKNLSDPTVREWWDKYTRLSTLAQELDFITETAEGILKDATSKDKFVPDDKVMDASELFSGMLDAQVLFDNPKLIETKLKGLRSYANMMNVIRTEGLPLFKDQVSELIPDIPNEAARIIMGTNDYDLIVKTMEEFVDPEVIKGWASLLKNNFNLFQKQPEIGEALSKVIGNKVKEELIRSGKFNLSARTSLRRKEPKFIPDEPGTTNFTDRKIVDGVKTEAIVPLEEVSSFNFAGTSNQPKGVNIIPDILINPVTDIRIFLPFT